MKSTLKTYRDRTYLAELGKRLLEFTKERKYTDVSVITNDEPFPVHKVILGTSSPFWTAMFERGFKEQDADKVSLGNVSSDAFTQIMNYVYTGKIVVSTETVGQLYEAADFLSYDFIKKFCIKFMSDDISKETCIQYFNLAEKYRLVELKKSVTDYLLDNFEKISDHFYELPYKTFNDILSSDELKCRSETVVLDVVSGELCKNCESC